MNSIGRLLGNQTAKQPTAQEFKDKLATQQPGFIQSMMAQARKQGVSEADIQKGLQMLPR